MKIEGLNGSIEFEPIEARRNIDYDALEEVRRTRFTFPWQKRDEPSERVNRLYDEAPIQNILPGALINHKNNQHSFSLPVEELEKLILVLQDKGSFYYHDGSRSQLEVAWVNNSCVIRVTDTALTRVFTEILFTESVVIEMYTLLAAMT